MNHHHAVAEVRTQPVVLDLGDGVGALVVHTGPELLGAEIEISPTGKDSEREHKQVLCRRMGATVATVLVFDNLPEGDYTLWLDGNARTRAVHVRGGSVTELDWHTPTTPEEVPK